MKKDLFELVDSMFHHAGLEDSQAWYPGERVEVEDPNLQAYIINRKLRCCVTNVLSCIKSPVGSSFLENSVARLNVIDGSCDAEWQRRIESGVVPYIVKHQRYAF